jgi:hypothetical protein
MFIAEFRRGRCERPLECHNLATEKQSAQNDGAEASGGLAFRADPTVWMTGCGGVDALSAAFSYDAYGKR